MALTKDPKIISKIYRNDFFQPHKSIDSSHSQPEDERGVLGELLFSHAKLASRNKELRRTVELLGAQNRESRALFTHAPACLYVLNADNIIVDVNPAGAELLGTKCSSLLGRSLADYIAEDDYELYKSFCKQLRLSQRRHSLTLRLNIAEKRSYWVIIEGVANFDETRETERLHLFISDIDKEKRRELRLLQSQKIEAIGTFARGISHDFNNILQAILGYSELVIGDLEEGSVLMERQKLVLSLVNRAKELVKKIFTFSTHPNLPVYPIHIHPIIKEAAACMRESAPGNISISLELAAPGKMIQADPAQIHQVLVNLFTNACKAMNNIGGSLFVALRETTVGLDEINQDLKEGKYLVLEISDTGPGIDPANIENIFAPYSSTKNGGVGRGLGLAIVNYIVKRHGGTITVESEPGRGTSFRVYLPCAQESSDQQEEAPFVQVEKFSEMVRHIMVVDDDPIIVSLLKEILERMKYSVIAQTDSSKAWQIFKERPEFFSLIMTDITMPNMTSIQLIREINILRPDVPVILSSGDNNFIDNSQRAELDICNYLPKPFTVEQVANLVNKTLGDSNHFQTGTFAQEDNCKGHKT